MPSFSYSTVQYIWGFVFFTSVGEGWRGTTREDGGGGRGGRPIERSIESGENGRVDRGEQNGGAIRRGN